MTYRGRGAMCALMAIVGAGACEFPRPEDRDGKTLTVQVTGGGTGTVTGGGITCSTGDNGTCEVGFAEATTVTITRMPGTAAAGSRVGLDTWGGDCTSAGNAASCTIVVDRPRAVIAPFNLEHRLELTISAGSSGQGQLTATPGGLGCTTGTCGQFYPEGSEITVDAIPASALDRVTAVSGGCGALPCALTIDGPHAVTASFTRDVCPASSSTCALGRATACDASGNYLTHEIPNGGVGGAPFTLVMHDYACPLGCHASGTRCNDVSPTNGLTATLDSVAASAGGVDLVLPRSAAAPVALIVIDTSNFDAGTGETTVVDADGTTFRVPARVIAQTDAPEILAIPVRTFTLRAGHTIEVRGLRALAIVSHFDIYLAGTIDLSAVASQGPRVAPGSYGNAFCLGRNIGPSGGSGGSAFGGSGNADAGGNSSDGSFGGGPLTGDGLQPLRGGCGLQAGVINSGGGALQLVSRTRIAMGATALVDVSGSGGLAIPGVFSSGGASGGSIVLEAPQVSLAAGAVLAGRGGSGAANHPAMGTADGHEGPTSGAAGASSVTCIGCGRSGVGGTETTSAGNADATPSPSYAGGGGSVGRCIVRNGAGALSPPPGSFLIQRLISTVATR